VDFGPVVASSEWFGLAVLEVTKPRLVSLVKAIKSVRAGLNRFELYPVPGQPRGARNHDGKFGCRQMLAYQDRIG